MADVRGVVTNISNVEDENYLTIQPPAGQEWMIINIQYSNSEAYEDMALVEFYKTDGINDILFYTDIDGDKYLVSNRKFFVTNDIYIKIKNISGSNLLIGYDGVRTK